MQTEEETQWCRKGQVMLFEGLYSLTLKVDSLAADGGDTSYTARTSAVRAVLGGP
mgnify:CR=1 FL=1